MPRLSYEERLKLRAQERRSLATLLGRGEAKGDGSTELESPGVTTNGLDRVPGRAFTDPSARSARPPSITQKKGPGALLTAGTPVTGHLPHDPRRRANWNLSPLRGARKQLRWRDVIDPKDGDEPANAPASVPFSDRPSNVYGIDGRSFDVDDWRHRLIKTEDQRRVLGNLANVVLILSCDPTWKDAFWMDEFTDSIVVRKEIPFPVLGRWNDSHEKQLTVWLQKDPVYRMVGSTNVTKETVRDALQCIVENKRFHSVATEYNALIWDGVPRLDRWLIEYAGAMDTVFARLVGAKFLLSLVARQFDPGCKVDTILVLEGNQGNKKSSVCRALAGPGRFFDDAINLESRDTATVLRGKTIVEFPELGRFTSNPKINEVFKVFVRKREDEHVHKWERHARVSKRSWVGMATVNKDSYLCDESGTRTVWPIPLDERVSIGPIERDRDQLLAEAVARYKWYVFLKSQLPAGADEDELPTEVRWWLVGEEEELAKAEQDKRFESSVWDTHIRQMMAGVNSLSVDEVLESIHSIAQFSGSRKKTLEAESIGKATVHEGVRKLRSKDKWSKSQQQEVVKVLKHYGWIRRCLGTRNSREWRYWRPGAWRNLETSNLPMRQSAMEIMWDVDLTAPSAPEEGAEGSELDKQEQDQRLSQG